MNGGPARPGARRGLSRRAVLLSAAAAGATVVGGGAVGLAARTTGSTTLGGPARTPVSPVHSTGVAPAGPVPSRGGVLTVERVRSTARQRMVDLVTVFPDGGGVPGMPMCLLLHGLGSSATEVTAGLNRVLADAVASRATPPFGVVAVDGGDSYWHANEPADDPLTMLLAEVPRWLAARSLGAPGGRPFAVGGFSMGGFGALLYARRRWEQGAPVDAVGVISPALITSWPEMAKRHAFHSAADWASMDPLVNLDRLGPAPIGLWVGDHDRFIDGCRRFIAAAHPAVGVVDPGRHTAAYLERELPDLLRFVGRHVPRTS